MGLPDDPEAQPQHTLSRRAFIKGVIAAGAVATSAGYLFRGERRRCSSARRPPQARSSGCSR